MAGQMKDFVNQYLTDAAVISVLRVNNQYKVRYVKDGQQYEKTVPFMLGHDNQINAIVAAIEE